MNANEIRDKFYEIEELNCDKINEKYYEMKKLCKEAMKFMPPDMR